MYHRYVVAKDVIAIIAATNYCFTVMLKGISMCSDGNTDCQLVTT